MVLNRHKSTLFWIVTFASLVVICSTLMLAFRSRPATYANIIVNGKIIKTVDLSVVGTRSFTVHAGIEYNVISYGNGRICISDSDCPDGICIKRGWVGSGIIPIVCLPHGVVVQLVNGEKLDFDAIVG